MHSYDVPKTNASPLAFERRGHAAYAPDTPQCRERSGMRPDEEAALMRRGQRRKEGSYKVGVCVFLRIFYHIQQKR